MSDDTSRREVMKETLRTIADSVTGFGDETKLITAFVETLNELRDTIMDEREKQTPHERRLAQHPDRETWYHIEIVGSNASRFQFIASLLFEHGGCLTEWRREQQTVAFTYFCETHLLLQTIADLAIKHGCDLNKNFGITSPPR